MNFRTRLLLFFVIIVVVPMIAVAIVLFSITEDNETGKADASLAAALRVARQVYNSERSAAQTEVAEVAADSELGMALEARDRAALEERVSDMLDADPELA